MSWSRVFTPNPVLRVSILLGSFMWGVLLLVPMLTHGLYQPLLHPQEVGWTEWSMAAILSGPFWAFFFLLHAFIGSTCLLMGRIRACTVIFEGAFGLLVWGVAITVYLIKFTPWLKVNYVLMQPFTTIAILSGNIVILGLIYINLLSLWSSLSKE